MIHDPVLLAALAPLARTVETVLPEADLVRKLARGRPLRCKLGLDLTATTVHIGNGIPLWNLRRLQELGHQAVIILGDYTAMVGDPSGKDKTRPMLTPAQVEANAATWLAQLGRVIDLPRAEIHRNSEWFSTMPFLEVLRLADRMTVQQMLERDSFEQRHEAGSPISIREFLYCLMQGWDSVMVRADVELGGTDQTFNIGVGRRLMEQEGLEPQVSLISPLLEGTDGGAKMSKSLGNCIGITDPPEVMFGMTMRISDALLPKYLRLVSDLPDAELERLLGPTSNPRDAKLALAQALVARYHDPAAAEEARAAWVRVISEGLEPVDMPEVVLSPAPPAGPEPRPDPEAWFVWEIVRACGFAKSSSEARRLVEGGGVTIRGERIAQARAPWKPREGDVVKVGSRRYARLRLAKE